MRRVALLPLLMPLVVAAQGYLENPQPMAYESGINIVSGWHCTAREITVFIDGVSLGKSGVGSIRNDTVGICGHANTGFSLLYNYNIPEPGEHEIAVYADGALLERRNFTTVRSGGVPFLSGRSATATIADFPESGRSTTVEWSQAKQSFVVVGSADTSTLDGTYSLRRASIQTQNSGLLDTAETNGIEVSGTMVVSGNSYRQSLMVSLGDSSPPVPIEVMGNLQDRGYYLYDRANGNQIVIVERGAAMITSLLYTAPDWGWTNEIDYWVKTR